MKLVLIPSGEFVMGSRESAAAVTKAFMPYNPKPKHLEAFACEQPLHRVRITRPFYLGAYHVTRGQFREFIRDTDYETDAEKPGKAGGEGADPVSGSFSRKVEYTWRNVGFEQTDEHPVVNVSWNDATAFCKWLSRKEGKTYRLPSEAEWEYACRGGTTTRYWCGDDPEKLVEVANVADAAFAEKFPKVQFPDWNHTVATRDGYAFTAPVGKFKPNPFGLYDLHGNAWEWCADWFRSDYYAVSPRDDPTGPPSGASRVARGGCWRDGPWDARSASRHKQQAEFQMLCMGFRIARNP